MSSSSGDGGGGDPKLPQDVVVEILKRLPVKSLLRFRCVSQSWRSAIDDPAFVVLHSNHSSLDSSNWYLMCLNYRHDLQDTCSLFAHDSLTLPSQLRVETPFVTPPRRFYFVGWCNGLICVADFSRNGDGPRMYLWNFFTRKHKAVRLSYRPEEPQFLSKEASSEFVGFGFDAGSNDYKIVTILHFRVDRRWFSRVGIYSLRTDSWRSLECEVPAFHGERQRAFMDGYLQWDNQRVFLNGNLHWVATKLDDMVLSKDASLFVFNVAGEVFEEMALPENKSASSLLSVAVLSDLLTVFFRAYDFRGNNYCYSVCTIWVMRDYGVPQSWTKLHTFEIDQRVVGFYGWTCNGELLMEIDCFGDKKRISLNLITGEVTVLPLSGTIDLVMLVENLVSLEI